MTSSKRVHNDDRNIPQVLQVLNNKLYRTDRKVELGLRRSRSRRRILYTVYAARIVVDTWTVAWCA